MGEPTLSIPFAIGETVWYAGAKYREEYPVCPDCAGTKFVVMRLGNGDEHSIECGCCGGGTYDGARGYMKRTLCVYEPTEIKLARVTGFDKGNVEYTDAPEESSCYQTYNSSAMFRDKAECQAACDVLREKAQAEKDAQDLYIRKSKRKDAAFSVSYWRSQAARLRKELDGVERRLNAAKPPAK